MAVKHLLSIAHLSSEDLEYLVNRSVDFAAGLEVSPSPLFGKIIGIYFRGPSTRTRTSFMAGALKLGGQTIAYGPNDLQLTTGEPVEDTVRVLSCYLDALVIRTNGPFAEMEAWSSQDRIAIINAMSENEHPTQAIADLATIKEAFGRLEDLHILYVGEGNNTAAALALVVAQTPGMKITFITPEGYGLSEAMLDQASRTAFRHSAVIEHHHRIDRAPNNVDVVYTTRWQTMGEPHSDSRWREKFAPYSVTEELLGQVAKPSGTIFLHDLPAVRGEDVSDEVLNGPRNWVLRQSHYKMFSAMSVLEWCLESAVAEVAARLVDPYPAVIGSQPGGAKLDFIHSRSLKK
jgi:ornithine carbamoyltransferase